MKLWGTLMLPPKMRFFNFGRLLKTTFAIIVIAAVTILSIIRPPDLQSGIELIQDGDKQTNGKLFKLEDNLQGKWRHLKESQIGNLTKLGRILYLDDSYPETDKNRQYKILIWKYGQSLDNRHIKRYTKERHDPFEYCSVRNCKISIDTKDYPNADLVLVHLHRTTGLHDLPAQENRNPQQLWAFLTDESPYHTFLAGLQLSKFSGIFNWSMTYRMDSDIPVPYGRTVLRKYISRDNDSNSNVYKWLLTKRHDVYVATMSSNCGSKNHRGEYVKELMKYIAVDWYGACGTLRCAGHFQRDCLQISDYMFYLSFENSNCDEYLTEKLWWNAYHKAAIPIVMGATKSSYNTLVPPGSYIHVDDFATPRDLATYLHYLVNNPSELQRYFEWKKHFVVLNEHGYFQSPSYHYCRACEALNYNTERRNRTYDDMDKFWSVKSNCYPAWDKN